MGPSAVRIGVLAPLSRPGWSEAGQHLLAGLELAVHDINQAGGVGGADSLEGGSGRPIELVVRDTAADPRRAEAAVDELAGLGVAALAGEYHSVVARAAATRADALGLPYLCSSAVLDALTDEPTRWVARLCPPQSRGWRIYADHLLGAGHRRIAVAAQPSVYWASGIRILHDHLAARGATLVELDLTSATSSTSSSVRDDLAASGATALLLLVGHPDPALPLVRAVRDDPRFTGLVLGAPAGQPELASWGAELGGKGAAIPFLRYLPQRLTPLGEQVDKALRARLDAAPSFVAFEGYDTGAVLAAALRTPGVLGPTGPADRARIVDAWPHLTVDGTRGPIRFSRVPGISVWQWAEAPVQVADRDPARPERFRVLEGGTG